MVWSGGSALGTAAAVCDKKKKMEKRMSVETKIEETEGWVEPEAPQKKRKKWKYILLVIVVVQFVLLAVQVISWYFL